MTRLYPSAIMVLAVGVAACGSEPTQPAAGGLVMLAGDGQTARAGTTLPDTVTLRVQAPDGAPQSGTIVTFVASDGGLAEPSADTSDSEGIVRTVWTLGPPEGSQRLTIQASAQESQTLTATGESGFHAVSIAVADPGAYGGPVGCGLDHQQQAWCWPLEQSWGQDTSSGPGRPVQAAGGIGFTSLQGGEQGRMCGLAAAGTLYCWHPLEPGDPGPTPVPGMPSLVSFSVSHDVDAVCGLTTNSEWYCLDGLLGPSATQLTAAQGHDFQQLYYGHLATCALDSEGLAYCWGDHGDANGQLGRGGTGGDLTTPAPVVGGHHFLSLANGGTNVCGLSTDGATYCWGSFWASLFEDPTVVATGTPTAIAIPRLSSVSLYWHDGYGLAVQGDLYWWGPVPSTDMGRTILAPVPTRLPGSSSSPGALDIDAIAGAVLPCGLTGTGAVYCWRPVGIDQASAQPYYDHWVAEAVPAP